MPGIVETFHEILHSFPDYATPVAIIKALITHISQSSGIAILLCLEENTMAEFTIALERLTGELLRALKGKISVRAGCELFSRFAARMASEDTGDDFQAFKTSLVQRANSFVESSSSHRQKISTYGLQFIPDNSKILVHSYSRAVIQLLEEASKDRRFFVFVTETRPGNHGREMQAHLQAKNIPSQVILDAAVGYFMSQVDLVLVGAEGVVENGGLVNQVGSFQIAVLAQSAHKPFYALAESYKFVRLFPLGQEDLTRLLASEITKGGTHGYVDKHVVEPVASTGIQKTPWFVTGNSVIASHDDYPLVDYTPPSYITLLFTDLGVLTPSGVSDELIKFYY